LILLSELTTQQQINLIYDLYVPDQASSRPLPLVIALHGYEGNKESMMSLARKINSEDFAIASLQGPNAFFVRGDDPSKRGIGFGWMMQYRAEETIGLHHRTVLSIIEHARTAISIDRRSVFLLGFSQTVSLNYRFAFTHPDSIRGVVAVCGGIPGDWEQDKYSASNTDVLIIAGETDEFYPLERTTRFKEAIERRANRVEFRSFQCGHVFPRESLGGINTWLLDRVGRD
jgi:phospholipase/carboxylesterase